MVLALLILMSLTVLGVSSVSSSLMQSKMATSMEKRSLSFDAAESAIAGVIFESEDKTLHSTSSASDVLSIARQGVVFDQNKMKCVVSSVNPVNPANPVNPVNPVNAEIPYTRRTLTSNGLTLGKVHTNIANYSTSPPVKSWSRAAFVHEKPCVGSSNVIGKSNISCHIFVVMGCGQLDGSNYVVANSVISSVFAPATK